MSVSKFPPNLNNPKSLLYELADSNPDMENVVVMLQTTDGKFKLAANQYDPHFLAVASATLQGLAIDAVWANSGDEE